MRIEETVIPVVATSDTSALDAIERGLEAVQRGSEETTRKFSAGFKEMASAARQEADAVKTAYEVKRRAAEDAARALRDSGKEGRDAARQTANAAKDEADALREVARAAEEKARSLEKSNVDSIRAETAALKQQEVQETQLADARTRGLERARDMGMRAAQMGSQGLSIGADLAKDYERDAGAEDRLEAMGKNIGQTDQQVQDLKEHLKGLSFDAAIPNTDALNNAGAELLTFGMSAERIKGIMNGLVGQTRVMNHGVVNTEDLAATAKAIGKAYGKGDVTGLTKIGVTLDDEQLAKLKELKASGADQATRQAALYDILRQSFDRYALSMTQGMSQAEVVANRQKLAVLSVKDALGAGTSEAKNQIDSLSVSLLHLVGSNPALAKTTGEFWEWGSALLVAGGNVAELGANIGLAARSGGDFLKWIQGIKDAREAQTVATEAATVAEGENAIATGAAGEALGAESIVAGESAIATGAAGAAAGESAIGFGLMATGIWGVVAAAGAGIVALGALLIAKRSWDVNKNAILSPTSSTTDKRTDKQKEDDAQKLESLNDIRERSKGLSPRDRYVVNRKLSFGYRDLGDLDAAGETSDEANALRKQLPKNFTTANSRDADILLKTIRGLNTGKNTAARLANDGFKGYGQTGRETGADKLNALGEKLQAQAQAAQANAASALAGGTPTAPVVPRAPRPSLLSRVRSAFTGDASGEDPYADQIRDLRRKLRDIHGRGHMAEKAEIQKQIDALEDARGDWREAHKKQVTASREESRQAKAAQRQAEKERKAADREQKAEDKAADKKHMRDDVDGAMIQSLERQNATNAQIANLQDQLDAARDAKDAAQVGQLTGQIARVRADAAYIDDLAKADLVDDNAHRTALNTAARLRHEGALDAARHEASSAEHEVRKMAERSVDKKGGEHATRRNGYNPPWEEVGGNPFHLGYESGVTKGVYDKGVPLPSQTPFFEAIDPTGMPSQKDLGRQRGAEFDSNVDKDGNYARARKMTGPDGNPAYIGTPIRINPQGADMTRMAFSDRIPLPTPPQRRGGLSNGDGVGSGRTPDTTFKDYKMSQVGGKLRFTSELDIDTRELSQALGVNQRGRLRG